MMHYIQLNFQHFKHLIANSHLMKNELVHRFHIPENKITVIYPGCNPQQFNMKYPIPAKKEVLGMLKIPLHSFIVGFLTSGDFIKRNLKTFLNTAKHIQSLDKTVRFIVVGHDKTIPQYQQYAHSLGIGETVIFTKHELKTEKYFKAFDVYVHPAHFEEFGMTVLEALACGIPVVTTLTTGAHEITPADMQDLIIKTPADHEKIASIILYLKKNSIQRLKLSQLAHHSVSRLTWDAYNENVSRVYSSSQNPSAKLR